MVDAIARELQSKEQYPIRQPLIIEEEIPQTSTMHVMVIWERWAEVPNELRSRLILDAYEKVQPEAVPNITIALGATVSEGIELNLLPYQIVTTRRKDDPVSAKDLELAMRAEGAVVADGGLKLAFSNQQMAEEVFRRLEDRVPGPYWAIQKVESAIVD